MKYKAGEFIDYKKLHWQSDWCYSEIFRGNDYPEDDKVVGLYSDGDIDLYIDVETGEVLQVMICVGD